MAFSPDSRRILTAPSGRNLHAGRDNRIRLWDAVLGQELLSFIAHANVVYGVAFSPDGRQLATASDDNTARIWTAFPWRAEDYPGDPRGLLSARIEQFKRQFARAAPQTSPNPERHTVSHYMGDLNLPPAGGKTRPLFPIPPRSPQVTAQQLDLSKAYNVALNESWQPMGNVYELDRNLAALGAGPKTLAGVTFDVRGLIQLRRDAPDCELFPARAVIPAGQRFHRLHALQGTRWIVREGMPIAALVLGYADGTQAELPIVYGEHLRVEDVNASLQYVSESGGSQAVVAWTGPPALEPERWQPRLYLATFENPYPEREVRQIEYVSKLTQAAPFLVALTVD